MKKRPIKYNYVVYILLICCLVGIILLLIIKDSPSSEASDAHILFDSPAPSEKVELSLLSTPLDVPLACAIMNNPYSFLSVPTQITKIGEDFFLVDCYHNQILTSTSCDKPLEEWLVLTDQINRGHTIAGDGIVYLADDTENNRILIFEKIDGYFFLTQIFENIGIRPHYVVYDEAERCFYVWSSMTGELYVFCREEDSSMVWLREVFRIPELDNVYTRSFTIDGNDIYFPACNGMILRTAKSDLNVLERWSVPDEIGGMIQLTKIQSYFYLSVSTDIAGNPGQATILRVNSLDQLTEASYEDLQEYFTEDGTPYYISFFDDHYYLTCHRNNPGTGVFRFQVLDDCLTDIVSLHP